LSRIQANIGEYSKSRIPSKIRHIVSLGTICIQKIPLIQPDHIGISDIVDYLESLSCEHCRRNFGFDDD